MLVPPSGLPEPRPASFQHRRLNMRQTQEPIRLTMHALMIGGEAVGSDRELEVAFAGIGRADVGLKLRSRGEEGVQTVEQAVAHLSETPEAMVAAQAMVARARWRPAAPRGLFRR